MADFIVFAAVAAVAGLTIWGVIKGKPVQSSSDPVGWNSDDSSWADNDWSDGDWGDSGGD